MKISPCGWFCLVEPPGWASQETRNSIRLTQVGSSASIDISSARKATEVDEDEVFELQEAVLKEWGLPAQETSLVRLPLGTHCVQSLCTDTYRAGVLVHVFWSHYCVRLQMDVGVDADLPECVLALRKLLESLEPLTTD